MIKIETFVTSKPSKSDNPRIRATLVICGEEYEWWDYDEYIWDAIHLAEKWQENEITYKRIVWLRSWLRENIQHNHNIPFSNIRSMKGCKAWIDKVIADLQK